MGNEKVANLPINISVIVVAYNCADVIKECILSCLNEPNVELIVVDNASKDNTANIVKTITDDRLSLVANTVNRGFTQACNQGIEFAAGKYVMLLNPDASLQTGSAATLAKYLDDHKDVGIVAPCLYYPNGQFQNYTRTFPSVMGLWVESFIPMKYWNLFKSYRRYTCQDVDFNKIQDVDQPAGAALMMREKWKLDETYFIYGSDVDLCKTVIENGYKIVQIPQAKVTHHQSKGGTENQQLRLFLDLDNYYGMVYYFRKHQFPIKAIMYKIIFAISLLGRAMLAIFGKKNTFGMRWKKFQYFIQTKNFTAIHDAKQ